MALRIGLLRSSALQNDGHIKPVILQCRTPQETNPKGHWGPNYFLQTSWKLTHHECISHHNAGLDSWSCPATRVVTFRFPSADPPHL